MKIYKQVIITLLILFIYSCKGVKEGLQEGVWIDKEFELNKVEIILSNGVYTLKGFGLIMPIMTNAKGENYIETKAGEYYIKYKESQKVLLLSDVPYIPMEQSHKKKISGKWISEFDKNLRLEFLILDDYSIVCEVNSNGKPVKYYPVKTDFGFKFTYLNEELSLYFDKENILVDGKGRKYKKI